MLKKHAEKIRFIIVGGLNTAIDFVILFVLVAFGLPAIVSNFFSTSIALVFSFFANKSYTFKEGGGYTKKQFIYFIIINVIGLWVIQPIIIQGIIYLLSSSSIDKYTVIFIGKIMATAITMVWSYITYPKFVFTKDRI